MALRATAPGFGFGLGTGLLKEAGLLGLKYTFKLSPQPSPNLLMNIGIIKHMNI